MQFSRVGDGVSWKGAVTEPLLQERESVEEEENPGLIGWVKTSLLGCFFPQRSVVQQAPHDFAAVTRNLEDREEWLAKGEGRKEQVQGLVEKLERGDWGAIDKIYAECLDNLPIDALKAFHEGKSTMEQFSHLLIFWSSRKAFNNVEIIPLFKEDGSVNPLAEDFIRQTLAPTGKASGAPPFLDEGQLALFFRKMRRQPKSESVFFSVVPKTILRLLGASERAQKQLNGTLLVTEAIYDEGINLLRQYTHVGQTRRMIPNVAMMQQLLNTLVGEEDAVQITPVIGISSLEEIVRNGETDTRDLALPGKGLPEKVDTLSAPDEIDVIDHDLLHVILASFVGRRYRRGFMAFAKAVKELREKSDHPPVCQILDLWYERVIDMEAAAFHRTIDVATPPFTKPTGGQKLLYALQMQQTDTFSRASTELHRQKGFQVFSEALVLPHLLSKHGVIVQLAEILHRQNFCARYGITRHDLKRMNDQIESLLLETSKSIEMGKSSMRVYRSVSEQMVELDGDKMTQLEVEDLICGAAARKNNLPLQLLKLMDSEYR